MSDDQVKQPKKTPHERPLDPTRDAEDFLGDPSGRDGVTTGDPRQISAEPDEKPKDESVLRGGQINDPTHINPSGLTDEEISDEAYNKAAFTGMSDTRANLNEELASETEEPAVGRNGRVSDLLEGDVSGSDVTAGRGNTNPEDIPVAESGEEGPGGSAPNPENFSDVGSMMAQFTGHDPDKNMDNPQELGIGDVVDKSENEDLEE
jgi:hypothetical protein